MHLFLGNEISRVDGLGGLEQLTELVLDRNKIKVPDHLNIINDIVETTGGCSFLTVSP